MTFNIENNGESDQNTPTGQPAQQPENLDQGGQSAEQGITPEDIAEVLKRDKHAQHHISSLEEENKNLRDNFTSVQEKIDALEGRLTSQKKLEELLTGKYTSNNQDQGEDLNSIHKENNNSNDMNTPTNQGLDQSSIDSMISERMNEYMTQRDQEKNLNAAKAELGSLFKDKADDHVRTVAESNGLSFEAAQDLAKSNPTLFNNLFVNPYKTSSQAPTPTQGRQSSSSVPESQGNEITMEYWNKMRRENPTKFQSVQTQRAFHEWFHNQNK